MEKDHNLSMYMYYSTCTIFFHSHTIHPDGGFALVWDNTQKLAQVRDQGRDTQNKMHLWANAYAAKNRMQPRRETALDHTLQAKDIPLASYFPNKEDEDMLQMRMETMVSHILVRHVPHFRQHYKDVVTWHIPHRYSKESAVKSTLVWRKLYILSFSHF